MDCPICFESFNSDTRPPLALPCQHNFCETCIQGLGVQEGGQSLCPTCRSPFQRAHARVNLGLREVLQQLHTSCDTRSRERSRSRSKNRRVQPAAAANAHSRTNEPIARSLIVKGSLGILTDSSAGSLAVNWSPHSAGIRKVAKDQITKCNSNEFFVKDDVVKATCDLTYDYCIGDPLVKKGSLGRLTSAAAGALTVDWSPHAAGKRQILKDQIVKCQLHEFFVKDDVVKATRDLTYADCIADPLVKKGSLGRLTSAAASALTVDWSPHAAGKRPILKDHIVKCQLHEFFVKDDVVKATSDLTYADCIADRLVKKGSLGRLTSAAAGALTVDWSPHAAGNRQILKDQIVKCQLHEFFAKGDVVKATRDLNYSA